MSNNINTYTTTIYGKCEIDSHSDTIFTGSNCVVLFYTGKQCNVLPYNEDYKSPNNVPIATVATSSQSPETGEVYIMVFYAALCKGKLMKNSLINPN